MYSTHIARIWINKPFMSHIQECSKVIYSTHIARSWIHTPFMSHIQEYSKVMYYTDEPSQRIYLRSCVKTSVMRNLPQVIVLVSKINGLIQNLLLWVLFMVSYVYGKHSSLWVLFILNYVYSLNNKTYKITCFLLKGLCIREEGVSWAAMNHK